MSKDSVLEVDGVVKEALKSAMFRVVIDGGTEIICHVSGKIRKNFINILPGDHVKVEMSTYDLTKGRIVYRSK